MFDGVLNLLDSVDIGDDFDRHVDIAELGEGGADQVFAARADAAGDNVDGASAHGDDLQPVLLQAALSPL
jgi:hypothetical protein